MTKINYLSIPVTVLTLCLSTTVFAKQPADQGNRYNDGPDARQLNSNKQSKSGDNILGRDRADERHDLKPNDHTRRFDNADDYRRQDDEHRNQKDAGKRANKAKIKNR